MTVLLGIILPAAVIGLSVGLLPVFRGYWAANLAGALVGYLFYAYSALTGDLYMVAVIFGMPLVAISWAWMASRIP